MTVSINGTSGIVFNDASSQNTAATGFGFKNRILNGQMVIDQRNAGASVTISSTANFTYTLDRWAAYGSVGSKFSVEQTITGVSAPAGFSDYLGVTSLAATSLGATDNYSIRQFIEGFNFADMAWGTASAATVTLSFWVRSSLTGTFGGSLMNSAYNRAYPFTYTISAANTWEQKSVTIAGDTSGTWIGATNGIGVQVIFGLGVGATYSGTAGAWAGSQLISATGATSVVGTNGATFYITGVQLEKGSTATSFDYRPYGTELALCQRYYAKLQSGTTSYAAFGSGSAYSTTAGSIFIKYPVTMRSTPTLNGTNLSFNDGVTIAAITAIGASYLGTDSGLQQFTSSGLALYRPYLLAGNNSTSAHIDLSAEL